MVEAICILFDVPPNWESGQALLHRENFFQDLEFYDKENLSQIAFRKMKQRSGTQKMSPIVGPSDSDDPARTSLWISDKDSIESTSKKLEKHRKQHSVCIFGCKQLQLFIYRIHDSSHYWNSEHSGMFPNKFIICYVMILWQNVTLFLKAIFESFLRNDILMLRNTVFWNYQKRERIGEIGKETWCRKTWIRSVETAVRNSRRNQC